MWSVVTVIRCVGPRASSLFLEPCLVANTGAFHKVPRNRRATAATLALPYAWRTGALRDKRSRQILIMVSEFGFQPLSVQENEENKKIEPTETLIANRVVYSSLVRSCFLNSETGQVIRLVISGVARADP
jgi:hypothetical protein